jgi:hypothetical protein
MIHIIIVQVKFDDELNTFFCNIWSIQGKFF